MSDLIEIFSRDPLSLSDQDIDFIIADLRGRRHLFNSGHKSAGSTKPKTEKQKEAHKLADQLDIDL